MWALHLPAPVLTELLPSLHFLLEYLPVILPIGLIFLIGSLQNIGQALLRAMTTTRNRCC